MDLAHRALAALFMLGSSFSAGSVSAQCLDQKLKVPGEYLGNPYGKTLALEGDTLVLGAPEHREGFGQLKTGAAFVFTRSGEAWVETACLLPSDGANEQHFGWSVALSGDRIVVGAPWDPFNTHQSFPPGAAYVFERTGTSWTETAKLEGSGAPVNCMVGWSVAIDGDVVAVGGPFDDGPIGGGAGRVWIFEHALQSWSEVATLGTPWTSAWFGSALALEGRTLLAGAPNSATGRVIFLDGSSGSWIAVQELQASNVQLWDHFGGALALDGDRLLVGAPLRDTTAPDAGAAYVFERTGGFWTQTAELLDTNGATLDELAHSVALDGDLALLGAPGGLASSFVGSATLFEASGIQWNETHQFLAPDAEPFGEFGQVTALSGDDALVLRWLDGNLLVGSGSVYHWSLAGTGCPSLLGLQGNVSVSVGGAQGLVLDAGTAHAGHVYFVLGSSAGTAPGVPVDGLVLPLAYDGPAGYMLYSLVHANALPLVDTLGLLDAEGRAQARFELPPGVLSGLVGLELHHAYVALDPLLPAVVFTSNAVPVELTL